MTYFVSDLHGELELFKSLLEKIQFSSNDKMYVCGDILEKGDSSVGLAKYIFSFPNIFCIVGNHDHNFLKYYHTIMESSPTDFDKVLSTLQDFFLEDKDLLDWDTVDMLDSLPYYIEEKDFICVHAGVPLDEKGYPVSLEQVSEEELVFDRRFKDPEVINRGDKCIFFGHTVTSNVCGEPKILTYKRHSSLPPNDIHSYHKVHLDTGSWQNGVLGCFCLEDCTNVYVKKAP
ncbi:MAG: metallophosphoesterase [Clostridia bacterium]|nr:metallophosphoesterase [Clostridia bacterium]